MHAGVRASMHACEQCMHACMQRVHVMLARSHACMHACDACMYACDVCNVCFCVGGCGVMWHGVMQCVHAWIAGARWCACMRALHVST